MRKDKDESETALQKNLLEYKTLVDPLTAEKAKHETDLSEVKMRNDSAKAELTLAESELKLVQQNETTEKRKYDLYAYSLEESKGTLIERKKTLGELEELVPAIKAEMVECDQSLKQYKEEEKEVRIEVNKLRAIVSSRQLSAWHLFGNPTDCVIECFRSKRKRRQCSKRATTTSLWII